MATSPCTTPLRLDASQCSQLARSRSTSRWPASMQGQPPEKMLSNKRKGDSRNLVNSHPPDQEDSLPSHPGLLQLSPSRKKCESSTP